MESFEDIILKKNYVWFQYVEYFIDRGVLGVTKELQHVVLEYIGDIVKPNTRTKWDSNQSLIVPTMPPTVVGVCRVLQIYYVLKVTSSSNKFIGIKGITLKAIYFLIWRDWWEPCFDKLNHGH